MNPKHRDAGLSHPGPAVDLFLRQDPDQEDDEDEDDDDKRDDKEDDDNDEGDGYSD